MRLSPLKTAGLIAAVVAAMFVALGLELAFIPSASSTLTGKTLFFLTLNLMVLALAALMVAVGKPLVTLLRERNQRVLGYKFKTKIMVSFVVIAAIPASLLFLISTQLGTSYIERIYTPQVRQTFEGSIELAKAYYDNERDMALHFADVAVRGHAVPGNYELSRMKQEPENASAVVHTAFTEGRAEAEIISGEQYDMVRAAAPDTTNGGIVVVQKQIPQAVTMQIRRVTDSHQDYTKIEAWKTPVKLNYLLLMGFFAITIIFAALWLSLKISGWITEPVRDLASATNEVAEGNLSVSVVSRRDDEMGLLVKSFNHMVSQMRDDKESLNSAYIKLNTAFLNMESIVRNIQSGVITLDAAGNVVAINAGACRILDLHPEEVKGRFYPALLDHVNSEELHEMIRDINIRTFRSSEKELHAEIMGRNVLLRVSISGLRGAKNEHLGILVVVDDITEIVKAQRALMWQEVAQMMAHEIKNPLTPILLSTERMLRKWEKGDEDFPVAFERATKSIIREVHSLKRLVDEFSKFGKMPEIRRIITDIAPIAEEVGSLYQGSSSMEFKVILPEGLPQVELDPEQFKRVLINLIENAIQAMHGLGEITLAFRADEDRRTLMVEVADTGPGIKDEDKERVFLPYHSGKKEGTGLGLAITHRIVKEHGGRIWVRDNKPKGCVFTIELPT